LQTEWCEVKILFEELKIPVEPFNSWQAGIRKIKKERKKNQGSAFGTYVPARLCLLAAFGTGALTAFVATTTGTVELTIAAIAEKCKRCERRCDA
jgi:hypothetical protein